MSEATPRPSRSEHHRRAGSIGGLVRAARQTNEAGRKQAAKDGFMARFYAEVPDHITDEAERARLARFALRAHMKRLGHKSALARAAKKQDAA